MASVCQWSQQLGWTIGHGTQADAAQPAIPGHGLEADTSEGKQPTVLVGKHPDQEIGCQSHHQQISPALLSIATGQTPTDAATLSEVHEGCDVAPAEIQTLTTHRMAAMAGFPD